MGRSVDYLNNAEYVIYFTADWIKEGFDWDDFKGNLTSNIQSSLKSYDDADKWDGRETHIFLENRLCEIGLSEYCGLYSLSIRVKQDDYFSYAEEAYTNNFGKRHAEQVKKSLENALLNAGAELLNRVGTFSNGTGVFIKGNEYTENNCPLGVTVDAKVS